MSTRDRKKSNGKGRKPRHSPHVMRDLPVNMTKSQFKPPISITFPPTIIGFPDRLITILKYSESYTFNGSAAPAAQQWTVNSAFDPNNTGVGHQPSFYDTFSAIYARYFVRAFKVDISVNNHATYRRCLCRGRVF